MVTLSTDLDDTQDGRGEPASILRLIREGKVRTRAEIAAVTGLARSTVATRVDALARAGLVYESGVMRSTGGRPSAVIAFNAGARVVLAGDLGATHCRLEVADLAAAPLAVHEAEIRIADGAHSILGYVRRRFDDLLEEAGRSPDDVAAVAVGVPGPVEFATGTPVSPPIMPGWDGVAIPQFFEGHYPAPVYVDNDVNLLALGEQRTEWPGCGSMIFVKVGTGIGSGIVLNGRVYRGAQGAAGDIGHVQLGDESAVCACGNEACVEAVASGHAVARTLREFGHETTTTKDVVALVRAGDLDAVRAVRRAGRRIGEVLAALVNFANPEVVVVGGALAQAHEQLLAGMRETVYQRSLPLATRHLRIVHTARGAGGGATGAAIMALDDVLSDKAIAHGLQTAEGRL